MITGGWSPFAVISEQFKAGAVVKQVRQGDHVKGARLQHLAGLSQVPRDLRARLEPVLKYALDEDGGGFTLFDYEHSRVSVNVQSGPLCRVAESIRDEVPGVEPRSKSITISH